MKIKKKAIIVLSIILVVLISLGLLLNKEVTTKQGIDYKLQTIRIPLYLKMLNFYNRHYGYKWLTKRIIDKKTTDDEKAMALFDWTISNLKKQPRELRAVDDHVWHIIIRGYGTHDQFSDVFTTLCNYAL